MSGDHAPLELLKGAVMAADEYRVPIAVVGDREIIEQTAAENNVSLENIERIGYGYIYL